MKPRELEALLRVLQRFGVTQYQTPDVTLSMAHVPAPPAKRAPGPGEDAGSMEDAPFELPELGPEDGDPETLLEDLTAKIHATNHPPRAGRVKRAS